MPNKLAEPKGCNTIGTVSFFVGLLGGTGSSIVIKVLYQLSAVDSTGAVTYFQKPLFLTWVMFVCMLCALPIYYVGNWWARPEDRADPVPTKVLLWLMIPSIFDLAGTNFAQIGLVFTTVSYFQLLRCTVIIVTAFLKAFVLKQRLAPYMWWGVAINILAMAMVSVTSFLGPQDVQPGGADNPALGVFFILLSCLVQGSQYIFEEKVMAVDDAPPLVVIGMEGFWGALIMVVMVFPAALVIPGPDKGSLENLWDSFVMVGNSSAIQAVLVVFFVTVTTYNIFCIYVTAYLSAIWHAILDNFRPVTVWGTDLFIYYVLTGGKFGEAWLEYSWLQFVGMLVLFVGTAVYNGSLRLPGLDYTTQYASLEGMTPGRSTPGMHAPEYLSTAAMMQSPLLRRMSLEHESPGVQRLQKQVGAEGAARGVGGQFQEARLRAGSAEGFGRRNEGVEYGYDGVGR